MSKKNIKFIIITTTLIAIDLLSKYFFYDKNILSNIFNPQFNLGISRSISIPLLVTIIISIGALILFLISYVRWYIQTLIATFLVAGTIWNLADRILLWWVRDFIDIQIFNFPIFNFADILLNIGVILFIIHEFWPWKKNIIK